MRRRLTIAAFAAFLLPYGNVHAQTPTLPDVLSHLKAYLVTYSQQYSATIATERYRQTVGQPRNSFFGIALLESDFGIVREPGPGQWLGLRDVYSVNGQAVQDRNDRLTKLFSEPFNPQKSQATKIAEESARFNIGPVLRTINNPALVLKILDPANEFRLSFSKDDEDTQNGVRVWVIRFREVVLPTLVRTSDGDDEPSEGRIWVEPASGRLLRAEITVRGLESFRATLGVVFQEDARLHLWVPSKMTERYEGPNIDYVDGEATYSNYRQFGVKTEEHFGAP